MLHFHARANFYSRFISGVNLAPLPIYHLLCLYPLVIVKLSSCCALICRLIILELHDHSYQLHYDGMLPHLVFWIDAQIIPGGLLRNLLSHVIMILFAY
jgi:hypothetical protein